jgi:putative phosphoribosyl transferase
MFKDRFDAGRKLSERLAAYDSLPDTIALALPRGGVPVAYEIARRLNLPLDIFIVRKLGLPGQEELAMGAIASGGIRVVNQSVLDQVQISQRVFDSVTANELRELERRERLYRGQHSSIEVTGKNVLLIDDGLATGTSMRAAIDALKKKNPAKIIVAVPVSPSDTYQEIKALVDDIVCVLTPYPFYSVGHWYEDFPQTSDQEVTSLLKQSYHEIGTRYA